MKKIKIIVVILAVLAGITIYTTITVKGLSKMEAEAEVVIEDKIGQKLTHAQDTWIRALEWCESNGNPEAINEVDLDGTSSYGAFQFKPDTFLSFGLKYGVTISAGDLMRRDKQYEVVEQMVLHRNEIQWDRQFPGCVRKLGWPPKGEVL